MSDGIVQQNVFHFESTLPTLKVFHWQFKVGLISIQVQKERKAV